jgi:hypothetical protein
MLSIPDRQASGVIADEAFRDWQMELPALVKDAVNRV